MKQLYLLRHATAISSDARGDKQRHLAQEGLIEATALGVEMARKHYRPTYILCSPATRTRETLNQLELESTPQDFPDPLYNGGAVDLLAHIQKIDDRHNIAMLVAHNPGIYEFTASMCVSGAPILMNRMMGGFKPCTMAVVSCNCERWSEILPGQHELKDFLEASSYNG